MAQTKIIVSGDMLEVYEYDNPYFNDYNELFAWSYTRPDPQSFEERYKASRNRTKNRIKRLIQANVKAWGCVPVLFTLTFAKNITSLSEANRRFRLYNQRFSRVVMDLGHQKPKYISIVEFQKRGAVHYHRLNIYVLYDGAEVVLLPESLAEYHTRNNPFF